LGPLFPHLEGSKLPFIQTPSIRHHYFKVKIVVDSHADVVPVGHPLRNADLRVSGRHMVVLKSVNEFKQNVFFLPLARVHIRMFFSAVKLQNVMQQYRVLALFVDSVEGIQTYALAELVHLTF
jgi:hypothetical protein